MNPSITLLHLTKFQQYIGCFIVIFLFNYICHYGLWHLSTHWWLFPNVSTFYMPVGLRLGLALILPIRYWPALLLSDVSTYLTIAYFDGRPLESLTSFAFVLFKGQSTAYYLPLVIMKLITSKYAVDGWLTNTKAVIAFFAVVLVNQLANVYDGLSYIKAPSHEALVTKITSLFAGGWVGIMLIAPLILAIAQWSKNRFKYSHQLVFTLIAPAILSALLLGFFTIKYPETAYLIRVLGFLPLLYFCYVFGWIGGVVIGCTLNLYLLFTNLHLAHVITTHDQLFYLFGFNMISLIMGAAISEQKTAFNQLQHKAKELEKSNQNNLKLAKKVVNIQENERKHLSQELHDEVGQNLVALQMEVKLLEDKYPILKQHNATLSIRDNNAQIYQSIYQMLHWLRPRVLDDLGLYKSLTGKYFMTPLQNANIQYHANIPDNVSELPDEYTIAIFRMVQESVTNTIKHSSADQFNVALTINNNVHLIISDNGQGFISNKAQIESISGFGLQGIKDRALSLNGTCVFSNVDGAKTEVILPIVKTII